MFIRSEISRYQSNQNLKLNQIIPVCFKNYICLYELDYQSIAEFQMFLYQYDIQWLLNLIFIRNT